MTKKHHLLKNDLLKLNYSNNNNNNKLNPEQHKITFFHHLDPNITNNCNNNKSSTKCVLLY